MLTEDEFADKGVLPGRPLPFIQVKDLATLPPPDQLGAWAHVHSNRNVTASDTETVSNDMAAVLPRLAAVLAENPDLACSRILCPRHLDPEEGYHAFLVPAFETGRLAGLGHDPAGAPGALASSWVDYPNRAESAATCRYYYRWQFRTAPIGDFEYLVRLLKPRGVDARVGNRDMDVRQPGSGLPAIDDPGSAGVLRLGGALKVPESDLTQEELDEQTLYENWDQPFPHPFQKALAALIDLADDYGAQTVEAAHQALTTVSDSFVTSQTVTPDDPDPLITPPLYGRWHALASRLLTNRDGTPIDPDDNWVHELNLDPRFRVPAGTGGRIVRAHDEEFMQAAWDQLGQVLEANRRIRAAQVARELTFVYHRRQLEPLRLAARGFLLQLTGPLQSRVVPDADAAAALGFAPAPAPVDDPPPRDQGKVRDQVLARRAGAAAAAPPPTVATVLADSLIARTPLSPAMRRVTRPGSPLDSQAAVRARARRAGDGTAAATSADVDARGRDGGPARAARAARPDERRRGHRRSAQDGTRSRRHRRPARIRSGRARHRRAGRARRGGRRARAHPEPRRHPGHERGLRRLPSRGGCASHRRGSGQPGGGPFQAGARRDLHGVQRRDRRRRRPRPGEHGRRRRRGGDGGRPPPGRHRPAPRSRWHHAARAVRPRAAATHDGSRAARRRRRRAPGRRMLQPARPTRSGR